MLVELCDVGGKRPGVGAAVWNAVPQGGKEVCGGRGEDTAKKTKRAQGFGAFFFLMQVSKCTCEWVKWGGCCGVFLFGVHSTSNTPKIPESWEMFTKVKVSRYFGTGQIIWQDLATLCMGELETFQLTQNH